MSSKQAVVGLVTNESQAETLIKLLQAAGFPQGDISVLGPDRQSNRDFAHENNTKAPEGAIAGAGTGGAVGGTIGLLAGIGALAIPGLGMFIAAGPIIALMSGAAAGAAVGGVTGALIGLGIPEVEAKQYEGKLKQGNILVSVHVADAGRQKAAKLALENGGARDIVTIGEVGVPARHKETPASRHV